MFYCFTSNETQKLSNCRYSIKYKCSFSHLYPGDNILKNRKGARYAGSGRKLPSWTACGGWGPTPAPPPAPPPLPFGKDSSRHLLLPSISVDFLTLLDDSLFCYPENNKYFLRLLFYFSLSSVPSP